MAKVKLPDPLTPRLTKVEEGLEYVEGTLVAHQYALERMGDAMAAAGDALEALNGRIDALLIEVRAITSQLMGGWKPL